MKIKTFKNTKLKTPNFEDNYLTCTVTCIIRTTRVQKKLTFFRLIILNFSGTLELGRKCKDLNKDFIISILETKMDMDSEYGHNRTLHWKTRFHFTFILFQKPIDIIYIHIFILKNHSFCAFTFLRFQHLHFTLYSSIKVN